MLPSQTIEQCFKTEYKTEYKTEQTELRATFAFEHSSHPPGAYWWDQNEVHMMQPLNGKGESINYVGRQGGGVGLAKCLCYYIS